MFLMEVKSFLGHFFSHLSRLLYSHADKLSAVRRSHTYYFTNYCKSKQLPKLF